MNRVPPEWATFKYFDPKIIVPRLQIHRVKLAQTDTPEKIRNLRTNNLQRYREMWDLAVFCYLLSLQLGQDIYFTSEESSDFDTVFTWQENNDQYFAPIQLKEFVPYHVNPKTELQCLLEKLSKYSGKQDLIVAIKLNRRERINFASLKFDDLPIKELWMFGATSPDEQKWSLFGEFLSGSPQKYEFQLVHT